jgi:hypothetical protein
MQMQESITGQRYILDGLPAIVVYAVCDGPTNRTNMLSPGQFDVDMELI